VVVARILIVQPQRVRAVAEKTEGGLRRLLRELPLQDGQDYLPEEITADLRYRTLLALLALLFHFVCSPARTG
jgi:hypothetical protein